MTENTSVPAAANAPDLGDLIPEWLGWKAAGQAAGAWGPRGIDAPLVGDANDYVGNGLSGGVHALRTVADADAIRETAASASSIAVIGGGWIGCEVAASLRQPAAMILGKPVFTADAPALRVQGRKVSNAWANLETLGAGIGDSLYGFRVYPLAPLRAVMGRQRWMRRFDFDPEVAVRLCWQGVRPINIAAPVKYFTAGEGGVSHFKYLRDNLLLIGMHTRLFVGFLLRLPWLAWRHLR